MPILRVQAELQRVTAVPEDAVVNTFHFDSNAVAPSIAALDATLAVLRFYNEAVAAGRVLGFMSSEVLTGQIKTATYNLADPIPRQPVREDDNTYAGLSLGDSLPEETAVCASFQGQALSGVNQARRRGRVFIGPLAVNARTDANGRVRVAPALRDTLCQAMERMRDDATAAGITWVVYSPTNASGTAVLNGWVDDAFDNIRSRGPAQLVRTTWS